MTITKNLKRSTVMACLTAFCALGVAGQAEARHHHKESRGRQAAGIIHAVADTIRAVTGQGYVVPAAPVVAPAAVVTPGAVVVPPMVGGNGVVEVVTPSYGGNRILNVGGYNGAGVTVRQHGAASGFTVREHGAASGFTVREHGAVSGFTVRTHNR